MLASAPVSWAQRVILDSLPARLAVSLVLSVRILVQLSIELGVPVISDANDAYLAATDTAQVLVIQGSNFTDNRDIISVSQQIDGEWVSCLQLEFFVSIDTEDYAPLGVEYTVLSASPSHIELSLFLAPPMFVI